MIGVLVAVAFVMGIFFGVRSCSNNDARILRDRNSKCFEQTQDKGCWGLR